MLRLADHMNVPEPPIRRYTLVPGAREGGVRRFHLAPGAPRPPRGEQRLERMEEIAALDRRDGADPERRRAGGDRA